MKHWPSSEIRNGRTSSGNDLLDRETFKRLVLARAGGRCVFCGAPAVDAHHILERKLFDDGGYRLCNGAAVCAACHWRCETTELSVADVCAAAGIKKEPSFPGAVLGGDYDKWGNRIWPSGLRSWGPLESDAGARKALAVGGVLGRMMPSTYCECEQGEPS